MIRISCFFAMIALALLVLAGCGSYVNVPAIEGDVYKHDPNKPDVQDATAEALRAMAADANLTDKPFQVMLAPGTLPATYDRVLSRVGGKASWDARGRQEGAPVLAVRQIFLRGWQAQVDVTRPIDVADPKSPDQLVTVYLKYDPVAKWYLDRLRPWRVPVDQALRLSRPEAGASTGVAP